MNKLKLAILLGLSATCVSTASATTTLRFSVTGTNRATGFSDQNGVAGVDGMRYGMIISTTDGSFTAGTYDVFDNSVSQFLKVGGLDTDDYYFTPGTLPTTNTLSATGIDPGGAGGISSIAGAPNGTDGLIAGVSTNDPFALMWFAVTPTANGSAYGVFTDPSFLLPASGALVDFNAPFLGAGADPIKAASFTFGGAVVPEPSRAILAGLGLMGLMLRRRRA